MASQPGPGAPQQYRRDLAILRDDSSRGIANLPAPSIPSSSLSTEYPPPLHVPGSAGACSNCRRYHRKCNYARPCSNCISTDRSNTCADQLTAYETQRWTPSADVIKEPSGIFGENATPCLSRPLRDPLPLLPLNTPISSDPFVGQCLHLPDLRTAGSDGKLRRAQPSTQKAGIVSAQPLPLPTLALSSITRGSGTCSSASTSTSLAENQPVTCILGTNMKLGRISEESLRTLGYHPHEMVTQALSSYLPAAERSRLALLATRLLQGPYKAGSRLPAGPVELQKVPLAELARPIFGGLSFSDTFKFRKHTKAFLHCTIELQVGSYFGPLPEQAIVIATITPLSQKLPRARSGPGRRTSTTLGTLFGERPTLGFDTRVSGMCAVAPQHDRLSALPTLHRPASPAGSLPTLSFGTSSPRLPSFSPEPFAMLGEAGPPSFAPLASMAPIRAPSPCSSRPSATTRHAASWPTYPSQSTFRRAASPSLASAMNLDVKVGSASDSVSGDWGPARRGSVSSLLSPSLPSLNSWAGPTRYYDETP